MDRPPLPLQTFLHFPPRFDLELIELFISQVLEQRNKKQGEKVLQEKGSSKSSRTEHYTKRKIWRQRRL